MRNSLSEESVKSVYSWQFYNCMKLWVLALTTASASDLALLVHPLVQLISGVIRLSNHMKYFPFHLKSFELLCMINQKTGQFVPAAQYILVPFESNNYNFFNAKPKKLEDKIIPDSLISLKIAKKHLETSEMKDRIIREALAALTQYLAISSDSIALPEMCISISGILRKFKKQSNNNTYRKSVQTFLELLQK
jgi:nucleolar complex protein 2